MYICLVTTGSILSNRNYFTSDFTKLEQLRFCLTIHVNINIAMVDEVERTAELLNVLGKQHLQLTC